MLRYLLILMIFLPSLAQAETYVLSESACRYLTEYQQAEGVEYQPGLDVDGNAVVPADINRNQIEVPKVVGFDITVDVAEYAGLPVPQGTETLARIGTVTIENNQLKFNGEPLKPESEQALIALCEEDTNDEPATGTTEE
jgi:hypothetical protein